MGKKQELEVGNLKELNGHFNQGEVMSLKFTQVCVCHRPEIGKQVLIALDTEGQVWEKVYAKGTYWWPVNMEKFQRQERV